MHFPWLSISSLVSGSALRRPATRLYPTEQRTPFAKTRGHIEFRVNDCTFCGICAHKCPTKAIVTNKKDKTWAIDHSLCILCGSCVEDCREGCIALNNKPMGPLGPGEMARFREEFRPPPPLPEALAERGDAPT